MGLKNEAYIKMLEFCRDAAEALPCLCAMAKRYTCLACRAEIAKHMGDLALSDIFDEEIPGAD